jgi:hypothetical protein
MERSVQALLQLHVYNWLAIFGAKIWFVFPKIDLGKLGCHFGT